MNKTQAFGRRNWFLKNAIYNMLIEHKDYFGIDAIEYNGKLEIDDEKKNIRYKLCNIVRNFLIGETYVSNTDIMAVLYKIDFTIVDGRLKNAIEHDSMVKDIQEEMCEEEIW